jgi:FAD dependent oxidoreductase TIGR03364
VRQQRLFGGLFSKSELGVNPRRAIGAIAQWLPQRHGVSFAFGVNVTAVRSGDDATARPTVTTADGATRSFDRVIVCGGVDVPLLFPGQFAESGLQTCKLQMLRTAAQPAGWRIGTHVASGLTLRHYRNFEICPSLPALKSRIHEETPELDRYGIHVMAAQTDAGEVILGDSHEYGDAVEPFDKEEIDELMLRELRKIIDLPDWTIAERWHGLYAKHPSVPIVELEPYPEIHLSTGTGGAGMTMAFGLAESAWQRWTLRR